MIEILHPKRDRERIVAMLGSTRLVDAWETAEADLAALRKFDAELDDIDLLDSEAHSRYVVYPWRAAIVRLPDGWLFHKLRTSRNRYLITDEEQHRWSEALIAVAGLSVGGSLLHTSVLTGARRVRIADPDVLGPTNLNRLAGSVCDLGTGKVALAARRILETDPYVHLDVLNDGVTEDTMTAFVGERRGRQPDVILEEVDDLAAKVMIRRRARMAGIPVVMVTDDGDNVIVDVERYDIDPGYPLFHGRADDVASMDDSELRDPANRIRIAGAIVGDQVGARTRQALTEVGRSIPSWPQLGSAATLAGAVGAVIARRIVCGHDVTSGRTHVRIDELLSE